MQPPVFPDHNGMGDLGQHINGQQVAGGALLSARSLIPLQGPMPVQSHQSPRIIDGRSPQQFGSVQHIPFRHIPMVLDRSKGEPQIHETQLPLQNQPPRMQYSQAFEHLNITDVDALRSLIEKLIQDAEQFTDNIRLKDKTITELHVKVLGLEGRLYEVGSAQVPDTSRFKMITMH